MSGGIGRGLELDHTARASESGRTDGREQSPEGREVTFRMEAQAGVRVRRPDEGSDEEAGQCDGPEPDGRTDGRTDGRFP